MWPANRKAGVTALSRYWTALVRRAPAGELLQLAGPLEPDLVATIERMRSARHEPAPDPSFVARLEDDLMRAFAPNPTTMPIALARPLPANGRSAAPSGRPWLLALPEARQRKRSVVAGLAAAAVVLLALGIALGPLELGRRGNDKPKTIPAAAVQATATPSVEFLWQSRGNPDDPMVNATNPAIAPDGNIWVPDGRNGRFQIFSPEGELLEVWGSEGTGDGQFNFLIGPNQFGGYGKSAIAFAPDGSFYVADTGNFRIQKFGPDRAFITAWGSEGTGDGQFAGTADLAVDGQGRVYVLDPYRRVESSEADAVQVFDADGRFLASWGAQGSEPGQLKHATGITVDRDGTILIADYEHNRIQRFTPEGEYLASWGEPGRSEGQISGPLDVAVDNRGNVYEVDYDNNRVQVFDRDGRFLIAWGGTGTVEGLFLEPVNVALDGEGNAYVTEVSGRVQKFRVQL